jgi:hypothetical protein
MALTDLQKLRLRIADQAAFHREEKAQEETGNTFFRLDYSNVVASPAPVVRLNGALQTVTTDYTIDLSSGGITFVTAPDLGDVITIEYTATTFTDEELEFFLAEAGDSITLAAANTLLAWAALMAQQARKESLSGGGGMGSMSITTDARARELRETAKAYYTQYQTEEGSGLPVEYITEVAWTEHMEHRMLENSFLDNL